MPDTSEPKHIITLAAKGPASAAAAGGGGGAWSSGSPAAEDPVGGAAPGDPTSVPTAGGRRVVMTAADGRRYSCLLGGRLPGSAGGGGGGGSSGGGGGGRSSGSDEEADAETDEEGKTAALAKGGKAAAGSGGLDEDFRPADVLGLLFGRPRAQVRPSSGSRPFDLLEKLSSTCLYRQEGLWTYEMCYKKHVRQFRQEVGGKAEDFSCGKYAGDERQDESLKSDASSNPTPIRYVSHVFTGGAECIMTGGPRSAEVRFTCIPDTTDNAIVSIREFPTCNYVMTVSTPFLCAHPDFKPPPETRVHTVCEPLAD